MQYESLLYIILIYSIFYFYNKDHIKNRIFKKVMQYE